MWRWQRKGMAIPLSIKPIVVKTDGNIFGPILFSISFESVFLFQSLEIGIEFDANGSHNGKVFDSILKHCPLAYRMGCGQSQ